MLYLLFGVATTALNLILFLAFFHLLGWAGWLSNAIAWWPSVVFAWWTNRLWVFGAPRGLPGKVLCKELGAFTGSRAFSGALDVLLIWLTVDVASWNDLLMKITVGIFIVLLNYAISRWWVFCPERKSL